MSVRVSFTDGRGNAESVTSAATAVVAAAPPAPNSPASGLPVIFGAPQVGQTLGVHVSSISDADGLGTFAYQWLADGSAIGGAVSSSYTLTAAEEGKAILVRVSFTDGRGHAESVTSAATARVAAAPPPTVNEPPKTETKAERIARLRAEYYALRETAHRAPGCGGICWNHPANAALKAAQSAYLRALFGG